jgi:hypothetical protein
VATEADKDDWRLTAELDVADIADKAGRLHELTAHLRGAAPGGEDSGIVGEVEAAVPHDAVITHDGKLLFAYAADEATIAAARAAIESVLAREQSTANVRISRWDSGLDRWLQTDPPLSAEQAVVEEAKERDEEAMETRTLVAISGKLVRSEFEQTMREAADQLGLKCEIVEHPHLLRTQVAFTVTGPKRKVEEFARDLEAVGWAYVRTERAVMTSPL